MTRRSEFAVDTSGLLNEPLIRQVIEHLRASAKHGSSLLTLGEHEELVTTARGLERILEWKTEEVTKRD